MSLNAWDHACITGPALSQCEIWGLSWERNIRFTLSKSSDSLHINPHLLLSKYKPPCQLHVWNCWTGCLCLCCPTDGFFVTGISLTEDLKYICSHPTESLKDLVMSTYPALLGWVRNQTPGSNADSLNIIAGDFVTESQFVPTVVALNEKLLNWPSWYPQREPEFLPISPQSSKE